MKNFNKNVYHSMDAIRIGEIFQTLTKVDKSLSNLHQRAEHAAESNLPGVFHIHGHFDDKDIVSALQGLMGDPAIRGIKSAKCFDIKVDDRATLSILGIMIQSKTAEKKSLVLELKSYGIEINDDEI